MREADCIDKGSIVEIIKLGTDTEYTSDYEGAHNVALLSLRCMYQGADNPNPNVSDTRAAFAIRQGLIEMCLGFIERCGEHESFGDDNDESSLYNIIGCIFQGINNVLLHQKTAKAIRSIPVANVSLRVARMLLQCQIMLREKTNINNNAKCYRLLNMVRSILKISGTYCCHCNKSLSKTEVKQCNGCGTVAYCSRTCQREDWINGHKLACCKSYTHENIGTFHGRNWPITAPDDERAGAKMKELEKNLNMVQLKLFLDNSDTILSQASSLNIPLYDCVIMFDLSQCPLAVEVVKYTDIYEKSEEKREFEESRSKKNITCTYCTDFYSGDSEDRVTVQRFFPHEWLKKQSKRIIG